MYMQVFWISFACAYIMWLLLVYSVCICVRFCAYLYVYTVMLLLHLKGCCYAGLNRTLTQKQKCAILTQKCVSK